MTDLNWKKVLKVINTNDNYENKDSDITVQLYESFQNYAFDAKTNKMHKADNIIKTEDKTSRLTQFHLLTKCFQSKKKTILNDGAVELHSFTFDSSFSFINHETHRNVFQTVKAETAEVEQAYMSFHFIIHNNVSEIKISDLKPHIRNFSYHLSEKTHEDFWFASYPGPNNGIKFDKSHSLSFSEDGIEGKIGKDVKTLQLLDSHISSIFLSYRDDTVGAESIRNKNLITAVPKNYKTQYGLHHWDHIFIIPKSMLK